MREEKQTKPIIDVYALAEQLDIAPRDTQIICQRLFWRIAEANGAVKEELHAAAHGTNVQPKTIRVLAELLGRDMRRPLSAPPETLGERVSGLADDVREKAAELKDRVSEGVASIDVATLRQDGAEKVAELKDRVAQVDVSEIGDQAKELGDKAIGSARSFVGRVREKFKAEPQVETASDGKS